MPWPEESRGGGSYWDRETEAPWSRLPARAGALERRWQPTQSSLEGRELRGKGEPSVSLSPLISSQCFPLAKSYQKPEATTDVVSASQPPGAHTGVKKG